MPHITKEQENRIREEFAKIEHERWAKWQKYMHSHVYDSSQSINPHLKVIPTELYNRWERQIATPYSELSEKEKDSDRKQVEPYIALINSLLSLHNQELIEKIDGMELVVSSSDYQSTKTNIENSGYNQALKDVKNLILIKE